MSDVTVEIDPETGEVMYTITTESYEEAAEPQERLDNEATIADLADDLKEVGFTLHGVEEEEDIIATVDVTADLSDADASGVFLLKRISSRISQTHIMSTLILIMSYLPQRLAQVMCHQCLLRLLHPLCHPQYQLRLFLQPNQRLLV